MNGTRLVAVFLSFVMVAGIGVVVTAASPVSFGFTFVSVNTFSPKLLSSIGEGGGEIDILIETNSHDYGSLVNLIEARGGVVTQQFKYINAIAASLPRADVVALAAHGNVARMYVDEIVMPAAGTGVGLALPGLEGVPNPAALDSTGFVGAGDMGLAEYLGLIEPDNYYNPTAAGVTPAVLAATGAGADTIVAIVDTGIISSHFLLDTPGKIVGGVDVSPDVGSAFEGFDLPSNHWHGSFVASVAAGDDVGLFLASDPLVAAIEFNAAVTLPSTMIGPFLVKIVPLFGIAPLAQLFITKVFPHTGAGVPSSIVIAGIEAVIDAKVGDGLDIDVMNLSLGGPVLFDGRDLSDQAIDAATAVGITPVISAGNNGPVQATVSSPGTSNTAITVAAASHPVNTRIFWDTFNFVGAGALALRVSSDIQIIDFSSRGPTADGDDDLRLFGKPDVTATGFLNFGAFPVPPFTLAWASGTSFSAPGVSGGVALLNSFAESSFGFSASPFDYKQAILGGASPMPVFGADAQGAGYLDVSASLADLVAQGAGGGLGDVQPALATEIDEDTVDLENIELDDDECNGDDGDDYDDVECFETTVSLGPGLGLDFVFEVERVEFIKVSITDVDLGAFNVGFNSFELYIHSAKRSTGTYYIETANVFGDTTVTITDDETIVAGAISLDVAPVSHIVEPGFFKIRLENDHTSADTVSGTIRIEVAEKDVDGDEDIDGEIVQGEFIPFIVVDVPDGTTMVIVELEWERDWTQYPTTDLDMFVLSNLGLSFAGATLNSPERVVLIAPAGVEIDFLAVALFGFEVNPFGAEEEFEIQFQFFGGDDDGDEDDDDD